MKCIWDTSFSWHMLCYGIVPRKAKYWPYRWFKWFKWAAGYVQCLIMLLFKRSWFIVLFDLKFSVFTLGIMSSMNFCPPKPGSTVMTRAMSIWFAQGASSSTAVPGFMAKPTCNNNHVSIRVVVITIWARKVGLLLWAFHRQIGIGVYVCRYENFYCPGLQCRKKLCLCLNIYIFLTLLLSDILHDTLCCEFSSACRGSRMVSHLHAALSYLLDEVSSVARGL